MLSERHHSTQKILCAYGCVLPKNTVYFGHMIKIWCKTLENKKIVRNEIVLLEGKYDECEFDDYVRQICHELDIPTPVVLSSHANSFTRFNICRFKRGDFVESVDFDELTLENCKV